MIVNLPRFALRYKAVVLTITLLLLAWGIQSFFTLPRSEDPEYRSIWATVVTAWPGATAEDIEQLVSKPIEDAISDLDDIAEVGSMSTIGLSFINVTLDDQVKDADAAWGKVRAIVEKVRLPTGTSSPQVDSTFADTAAMVLTIQEKSADGQSAARYSPRELKQYADLMKEEILKIESVARIQLFGDQREAIYLEPNSSWNSQAITIDDLQKLLTSRNLVSPGGSVDAEQLRISIKPEGNVDTVDSIENLTIVPPSAPSDTMAFGTPATLRELGIKARRAYEEPARLLARVTVPDKQIESQNCIALSILMKDNANILKFGELVRSTVKRVRETRLPVDCDVSILANQPKNVDEKISGFFDNLWQAVLIVIVVAYLIVGFRAACVMAASIPLVMVIAFGLSSIFDVHIEVVSLASLIIALGMLVDCAIEVADNVQHHLQHGKSRVEATIEGTQQIAFPVLIGALTTVGAFLPMLLIPGTTGEYIYSLPVVVSITLCVSWVLAMTVTSLMSYWLIRASSRRPPLIWLAACIGSVVSFVLRKLAKSETAESEKSSLYTKLCRFCVNHQMIAIVIPVVILIGGVWLVAVGEVGTQFFPSSDRAQFVIDVSLPNGTAFEKTSEVCADVEELVRRLDEDSTGESRLASMVAYVGQGGPRFYSTLDPVPPGSHYAQVVVNTKNRLQVDEYVNDIRMAARSGREDADLLPIIDARIVPYKLDMGPPVAAPIEVQVFGPKLDQLHQVADEIKNVLEQTAGTRDVFDSLGNNGAQLTVITDEQKANVAGVTHYSVARTLNAGFSGHPLTVFREDDQQIPVYFRRPKSDREKLPDGSGLYVEGTKGKVPLNSVASVAYEWKPIIIRRENRERVIGVRSRVKDGFLPNSVLATARKQIDQIEQDLLPGYSIKIGGELEQTVKGQRSTLAASGVSVGLILLLLVVQYNSFTKPIVILVTLPLAVAGSIFGLWFMQQPLGFMAGLGVLSLVGIVINDGLVLVEFIEHLISGAVKSSDGDLDDKALFAGLPKDVFRKCVVDGCTQRLLPISLTTLTTVGGLIPLAISGGPLFEPLATVLIFGLLLGVLVMLLTLPAIYCVFVERFGMNVFPGPRGEDSA